MSKVSSEEENASAFGEFHGTLTVQLENMPKLWGLVPGGAQMPPLIPHRAFLLDSNAVTFVRSVDKMLEPEKSWWETMLADPSTTLNPLPYALEGNNGHFCPTDEQFRLRYEEAVSNLSEKTDGAQIIEYGDEALEVASNLISSLETHNQKEGAFLIEVASMVKVDVAIRRVSEIENLIIDSAQNHGIRGDSLTLYACLSSLHSRSNPKAPARKVLKAGLIEQTGNPYNALTDLSLLRVFVATIVLASKNDLPAFSLLTKDKGLREFWMGLQISGFDVNSSGDAIAKFVFSQQMFPSLDEDARVALAARVSTL